MLTPFGTVQRGLVTSAEKQLIVAMNAVHVYPLPQLDIVYFIDIMFGTAESSILCQICGVVSGAGNRVTSLGIVLTRENVRSVIYKVIEIMNVHLLCR